MHKFLLYNLPRSGIWRIDKHNIRDILMQNTFNNKGKGSGVLEGVPDK